MELDDFKKNKHFGNIPEGATGQGQNAGTGQIIESFKSYETKKKKRALLIIISLVALSIIYSSFLVRENNILSTGFALIIAGFLLGAAYLYFAYKPLPESIYSLPMTDFLDKAENKLKFMKTIDFLVIIPLLLMGTGGGMVFIVRLSKYTENFNLLLGIWIAFFLLLVIFAFYVSRKDWEKEHGELLREIRSLKNSGNFQD